VFDKDFENPRTFTATVGYEREIFAGIASREIASFLGIDLLRRPSDDMVEFVTIMWFESLEAVRCFAGTDYEVAVVPPGDPRLNGRTYAQLAADCWKWTMELPLTNSAGFVHPGIDAGQAAFDVSEGQSASVWFLAAPFGTVTRSCTIPSGKPLVRTGASRAAK